ncbi:Plasmodium vivax Vir protein, putative [Plasmodium vivax]|nr:Plasmodium vivax Vir protein, putative [Plasmodium vivax]
MGCEQEKEVDSYDFFDKIENYIDNVNNAQSSSSVGGVSGCNTFSTVSKSWFNDELIAKNVCEELIKLYESLNYLKNMKIRDANYNNESRFFNYWVNFKISKSMIKGSDCIQNIFNSIESQCDSVFHNKLDISVIYDIDKNDMHKMNILYNLYENYVKIKAIIDSKSGMDDQSLYSHSTACCTDYFKTSYICDADNKSKNLKFCEKLETFVSKYRGLYNTVDQKGPPFTENFIKLEECPNPKIITTAVTGTVVGLIPLFGVLYKFTPMGQMFRSKIGILNNNISNNEEMTKISLIEQGNEPIKFQQGKYNIKYQSL